MVGDGALAVGSGWHPLAGSGNSKKCSFPALPALPALPGGERGKSESLEKTRKV